MSKRRKTTPRGRDAGTGQFIPVSDAKKDREGAVVERVPVRKKGK